ncbi:Neutral ceramidase, partial [Fragariocoptes setiger]
MAVHITNHVIVSLLIVACIGYGVTSVRGAAADPIYSPKDSEIDYNVIENRVDPSAPAQWTDATATATNNKNNFRVPLQLDNDHADQYSIGVGIADMTGPAADINLMGYAKPNQDAGGIHLRQFSRAIIFVDKLGSRVVYVSTDAGMVSQALRTEVLKILEQKYNGIYNRNNVMISATHTHSCPGGFFQYLLYNIPSQGFISQTLEAMVNGIVRSVDKAHANMKLGYISYAKGQLVDASINRSPTSYELNPAAERALYEHNTDKEMVIVKMTDLEGKPIAMLNWFPVHGTSMNNTNHLISSDNKGYASLLFEQDYNHNALPGKGQFVAIFAQANEGDVSPNTGGPRCIDTGLPCDSVTSTCGNPPRNERCVAFGPGRDMFESTKIIAYRQYAKARQLFDDNTKQIKVSGPIKYVHQHVDMSDQVIGQKTLPDGNVTTIRTCKPALGYSFAAGTTDGPGAFDFTQGDRNTSPFWNMVRDFVRKPSPEESECHFPKPILLSTGEMSFPYAWQPSIVPTQIITIGQLAIVGLPGEFTTMSGRRVRNAVAEVLNRTPTPVPTPGMTTTGQTLEKKSSLQQEKPAYKVVLSGLSNVYTSYVTTFEEYQMQRYEGASTLYGPHTLEAYVMHFKKLAQSLSDGSTIESPGPEPPNLLSQQITLKPGVIYDGTPFGRHFGDCIEDVDTTKVYLCTETVRAAFVSGHPRNDLRQEDTFMLVERFDNATQSWLPIASDASWDTKFIWQRTNSLMGESRATLEWNIPHDCRDGTYRFRYFGSSKNLMQQIKPYEGVSSSFLVGTHPYGATTSDISAAGSVVTASIQSIGGKKIPDQTYNYNTRVGQSVGATSVPLVPSQHPRKATSVWQTLASYFGLRL